MPIRHVVMFHLKDEALGATKAENLFKMKTLLDDLPSKIPQIKFYECGMNVIESPRAWDFVLVSAFDSAAELDEYRIHPEHQKVVEFIQEVTIESRVVDYEF